jgi:exopolysaccharide production protein ExoZ
MPVPPQAGFAPDMTERPSRLAGLEMGRGIAALLVVLYHGGEMCEKYFGALPFTGLFRGGHAGVEYFFVLSGFIMVHVHVSDIGRDGRFAAFLKKRVVRIIPMYWLVLTGMLAAFLLHPAWGADKQLTFAKAAMDYFLLPRPGPMTLPPAWTLQREFLFYLVFGLVILRPRAGVILFGLWQAAVIVKALLFATVLRQSSLALEVLFGVHNVGFLVGAAVALLVRNGRATPRAERGLLIAGIGGFVGLLAIEWQLGGKLDAGFIADAGDRLRIAAEIVKSLAYTTTCGLIVWGSALWASRSERPTGRAVALFGAASYLIYLIHEPLASLVLKILKSGRLIQMESSELALVAVALAAVGAAVILHLVVETRVTGFLRQRFLAPAGRPGSEGIPRRHRAMAPGRVG